MDKVIVMGCPGSGKKYIFKSIERMAELPLYHLDLLNWNSDKTTVEKTVFIERLKNSFAEPIARIKEKYQGDSYEYDLLLKR